MAEYYADGERIQLKPSTAFVALQMNTDIDTSTVMSAVDQAEGLASSEAAEVIDSFNIILVPAKENIAEDIVGQSTEALAAAPGIISNIPVYQIPDGEVDEVMILVPQFRVQFKPDVSQEEIDRFNSQHSVEVIAKDDLEPNSYLLGVAHTAQTNALDLANLYHENDLTEYAAPDWVYHLRKLAAPVNDPHYSDQWALPKMNVPQAWWINKGRSSIKIAIIDEGVQTSHPDLSAKIVTPYDAVGNDNNQEPNSWDGHGTACAGIAAAVSNNRRGVAGVARECKILPVRIAYSTGPGRGWITNETWIARGIRTAVNRGADVLSNSWGGGSYSSTIRRAFQYAQTRGRGGKGCVVISASGNSDRKNGVIYPAKYPESLACGSSNEWDKRKSKTSQDGEYWWGSNYGSELDFLAPGVHIYTTDISGSGGYGSGDYYHRFNGTSSATPNAAGVAALVLSRDPNLRYWEVRDILRLTAKDLGSRGRDDEHGWGRLDAHKALLAAAGLWWEVRIRLEFLGRGQECYLRFQTFRLYNSGLNRVRVNGFNITSFNPAGTKIDQFQYRPNPGGIMMPGIAPGGSSGHDLKVQSVLLKANGNRSRWSYRWNAHWWYTYWRPGRAVTSPLEAMESPTEQFEEEVEQEFEITVNSEDGELSSQVTMEEPLVEGSLEENQPEVINKSGLPVKITITVE